MLLVIVLWNKYSLLLNYLTLYINDGWLFQYLCLFSCFAIAAVKRYFTSKKEAANRKSRNKETLHKQRQATYERKKEASCFKILFKHPIIAIRQIISPYIGHCL